MRLHLDADTSLRALHRTLNERGYDVTRTPNSWMPANASDVDQLLGATGVGRAIFTFNVRDFIHLADRYPNHGGIVLAVQNRWQLRSLIRGLGSLLDEYEDRDLFGTVHWLKPG